MTSPSEISVWGFDGDLAGNESRLMIRLPIFKLLRTEKLGMASVQPWSPDDPSTVRWFSDEAEAIAAGTNVQLPREMEITPGSVLMVAGPHFLNDLRFIVDTFNGFINRMIPIQEGFSLTTLSVTESLSYSDDIVQLSRNVFDQEVSREKFEKLTDKANASLRVLRGTPTAHLHELATRKLVSLRIQNDLDGYETSLQLSAVRLEITEAQMQEIVRSSCINIHADRQERA